MAAEDDRNEMHLGDVQLVNSEVSKEVKESEYLSEIVPNEEIKEQQNLNGADYNSDAENIESSTNRETYFVETKLQRDTMYSEMLETYQKMLESAEVGETQKAIASEEITNITNIKKNKGFENVVILVNNGSVSVIVKTSLLNQEQIAQIQNIISRELKVEVENINISNI